MKKRFLLFMVAILMVAAGMTSCGKTAITEGKSAESAQAEDIEFLVWWAKTYSPEDANIAFLGEKFKAKFHITTIPYNVYFDKLNIRIAANDLPVMYKFQIPNDNAFAVLQEMEATGKIEDLRPLIKKYKLVSLEKYLSNRAFNHLLGKNGEQYCIPVYMAASSNMLYLRQDWLDKLGLATPKTWDEVREVAKAFKAANLSGKVTAGMGGYIASENDDNMIFASFLGFAGAFTEYQGKWIHRVFHPEFKEAVRFIRDSYQEGSLHPTSITNQSPNERMSLFINENVGILAHNGLSSHYENIARSLKAINPDAVISFVPMPANRAGKIVAAQNVPYVGASVINASRTESEKVKALRILDYLYSDAGKELMFDGVPGVHYKAENGKKVFDPALRARDFIGATSPLIETCDLSFPFDRENEILKGNYEHNKNNVCFSEVVGLVTDPYLENIIKINEVIKSYLPKFYLNQLSLEKDWDRFLDDIKGNGYDTVITEVEKFME